MNIYLDTKDLVRLVEKISANDSARIKETLTRVNGRLVYSMFNIMEIAAPLAEDSPQTTVMRSLNRLEDFPHKFMDIASIDILEIKEAARALGAGAEYESIPPPFVPRFDYTFTRGAQPATSDYLRYCLALSVYELWIEDKNLFLNSASETARWPSVLQDDREFVGPKDHLRNFQKIINASVQRDKIDLRSVDPNDLAKWIWHKPTRCPAIRLGYELFHVVVNNRGANAKASDISDFAHMLCLPYVDAITLDGAMASYVAQVDRRLGTTFSSRVLKNLQAVEQFISPPPTPPSRRKLTPN